MTTFLFLWYNMVLYERGLNTMGKLSTWIKKNILNEKQTENEERNEYNAIYENKREENISKIKKENVKEKIYISHMDDLFWEAGRFVIEKEKGSIGMLQRQFKISFNRAARIMDELCKVGVVGEEIGTAPRKVLITKYEFEELQYNDLIKVKEETRAENEHKEQSVYTVKQIETILRVSFGIDADYSKDGRILEAFKNYIVPSVSSENQTEVIDALLKYNSPITMRLILIDDSIINYSPYNTIPHMFIPVVTNEGKYDAVMSWCHTEMQNRINIFVENGVKNIDSFNQKIINTRGEMCPKIIFVINEISSFLKCATVPLEKIFLNCNMTGIYFIMFSRFSTKNLSLGRLNELFEISTLDKLKTLLSQGAKAESEQIIKINYDDMNGYQFEKFCAEILRKNGFENIELTQGSGDHGIDILAEKDNITYAIQCKCYSSNIGNAAVQQVHTGKSLYHKDIAVVITNRYFTTQAIEEADALGVKLWDRDYLQKFIDGVNEAKTEANILRDYNENREDGELRILDIEEKIVAIEDGEVSKYLYNFLDEASRYIIDTYLKDGKENVYVDDMIKNIEMPILLYNVKFISIPDIYSIKFVYYCKINNKFKDTSAYQHLMKLSENTREDDVFNITVYYGIDDIVLEGKEIKIKNMPEVSILPDTLVEIQTLEDIDKYDLQNGHKHLVTENFFPMKIDNMKFE